MSVYTQITEQQVKQLLAQYSLGQFVAYQPVAGGLTNTIYFVSTDQCELVLTLFEALNAEQVQPYIDLTNQLVADGFCTAKTYADDNGNVIQTCWDKPAILSKRLPGITLDHHTDEQLQQCAQVLAQLHGISATYRVNLHDQCGASWQQRVIAAVMPVLDAEQAQLLHAACDIQQQLLATDLPQAMIHADCFRDNMLFDGSRLTGLIDFYYAYYGVVLFDIAVALNDWCGLDEARVQRWLVAYEQVRLLSDTEQIWLPQMRCVAALRFWLSRLYDKHFPPVGQVVTQKDPQDMQNLLQCLMSQ